MRVHAEQERHEQMMSVPEGLEGLLSDPVVGRGVHEEHAEQHDVARDASCLCVVDLEGDLGSDLALLYVVEAMMVSTAAKRSFSALRT